MIIKETKIPGAYTIEPEPLTDDRGFFARVFSRDVFDQCGLESSIVQCSISFNRKKGTLRGVHYQKSPYEEAKIVSCTRGAIYDVVLDLRKGSVCYGQWMSVELTDKNYKMVFIPKGCAHGFQSLQDDTVVFYQMTEFYHPECAEGVRWNDPAFDIFWPFEKKTIARKDNEFPDYCL